MVLIDRSVSAFRCPRRGIAVGRLPAAQAAQLGWFSNILLSLYSFTGCYTISITPFIFTKAGCLRMRMEEWRRVSRRLRRN
jgi:hypothetical protein